MEKAPEIAVDQNSLDWFALQVRTRWEQSTAKILSGKGYETLLPTYQSERRGGGRVRAVELPLFPSYVFCRFDVWKRLPILITPGVVSIVSRGRVPVPVEQTEISALQRLVLSGVQAEPWPYLAVGDRIRIQGTVLRGLEGILIAFKGGHRVVVSVSLLRRSVAVEIDQASVKAIEPRPVAAMEAPCTVEVSDAVTVL